MNGRSQSFKFLLILGVGMNRTCELFGMQALLIRFIICNISIIHALPRNESPYIEEIYNYLKFSTLWIYN